MTKLFEQRAALLAEFDKIKNALFTEKRSAYTAEEREAVNKIKIDLADLDNLINDEKEIEAKRSLKLDNISKNQKSNTNDDIDIVSRTNSAFVSYLKGEDFDDEFRSKGGNFLFSTEYFTQRATVTAAGDSNTLSSTHTLPVSTIEKALVLDKIGAPSVQFVSGGGFKAPYLASTPASYNAEDVSNGDIAFTSDFNLATPSHSSASVELSGTYLKSMSAQSVDVIVNSLVSRIYQGLDKRGIEKVKSAATIETATTGVTYYEAVLDAEKQLENVSGYLFSKNAGERAKRSKVDSGSGALVLQNKESNGYTAAISSLVTGDTFIAGDFSHVQRYIWDGVEVNIMQGTAEKRKGNYVLIADAFSDAVVTNPAAFVAYNSTNLLALS